MKDLQTLVSSGLTWKEDLLEYEGPLISLFQVDGASFEEMLAVWCDRTETHNRWLLFSVTSQVLAAYRERRDTLYNAILAAEFVGLWEVAEDPEQESFQQIERGQVPQKYMPSLESLLPVQDYQSSRAHA